jgi:exopolysaccharide biosynthesis polyprenyl glycosylphosphotransferase
MQLAVLAVDAAAGLLGSAAAYAFDYRGPGENRYAWGLLLGPIVWVLAVVVCRGYQRRFLGSGSEEYRHILNAGVLVAVGVATVSFLLRTDIARSYLLIGSVGACGASAFGRYGCRRALGRARRSSRCMHDVVLVGHESTVLHLVSQIRRERAGGLRILGACVPGGASGVLRDAGVPVLGDLGDVPEVVATLSVDTVAVTACAEMYGAALRRLAWQLEGSGVDLVVAPGLVEVAGPRLHIRPMCGLPLLHVEEPTLSGAPRIVKSVVDRCAALLGLLAMSPALLLVAFAIIADTGRPIFYSQRRVGRGGREFRMWKFRTMHQDAEHRLQEVAGLNVHGDEVLFKIPRDPRITRVGAWLRKHSVDEFPQLINVVLGDMSVVGPRPPLPSEVSRYGTDVHRRLLVKPGVTGLWQVSGRSDLSWDESIRLDLRYVENWSLALDALIVWRTFGAVLRGSGAY